MAAVVAEARRSDPSLPAEAAELLARAALESAAPDAAGISRALLDRQVDLDASWANAVATAVMALRST